MRFVMLAALAGYCATGATAKTINGKVDVTLAGDPVGCVAAKLIPRTPATERAILAQFGALEAAVLPVDADTLAADGPKHVEPDFRQTRCKDWRGYGTLYNFRFKNVAPGDYFVTMLSRRGERHLTDLSNGHKAAAVYLMQPVRVAASGVNMRFVYQQK